MTENRFRPRSLDSAAVGRTLITVGNSALAVLLALAVGAIQVRYRERADAGAKLMAEASLLLP